jgi:hypothetical protein
MSNISCTLAEVDEPSQPYVCLHSATLDYLQAGPARSSTLAMKGVGTTGRPKDMEGHVLPPWPDFFCDDWTGAVHAGTRIVSMLSEMQLHRLL